MIDTMSMRLIYNGQVCWFALFFFTTGVNFFPEIIYFIFDDLLLVFEFIIIDWERKRERERQSLAINKEI